MHLQVRNYLFFFALKALVTYPRAAGRPQELQHTIETFACGTGNVPNLTSHCTEPISTCLSTSTMPLTAACRWNYVWT